MKLTRTLSLLSLLAILILLPYFIRSTHAHKITEQAQENFLQPIRATLSQQFSLQGAKPGNSWINLHGGRDLLIAYDNEQFLTLTQAKSDMPFVTVVGEMDENRMLGFVGSCGGKVNNLIILHRSDALHSVLL